MKLWWKLMNTNSIYNSMTKLFCSEEAKEELGRKCGISVSQVNMCIFHILASSILSSPLSPCPPLAMHNAHSFHATLAPHASQSDGSKTSALQWPLALCTNALCFFSVWHLAPIHQMQQVLHLGGKTFKNANYHTTILGEQLVWKQEDPVQEEHRESSG